MQISAQIKQHGAARQVEEGNGYQVNTLGHPWDPHIGRILELSFDGIITPDAAAISLVLSRIGEQSAHDSVSPESKSRLTELQIRYCHLTAPNCADCPLRRFCSVGRKTYQGQRSYSYSFIDLFCGAGGLSLGLEKYGLDPEFAVDHDTSAIHTYTFNRPWISSGIVKNTEIDGISSTEIPKVPVVVGGPPCQGFSNANRQRLSDDPRNHLYKKFIEYVAAAESGFFILENVTGMLKSQTAVENDFSEIGFLTLPFILSAYELGYPQNRKRVFWLGVRTQNILLFNQIAFAFGALVQEQLHNNNSFVLSDAIEDLPPLLPKTIRNATHIENDQWGYAIAPPRKFNSRYCFVINGGVKTTFLYNHRTKYNNERDIEIYRRLKPGEKSDAPSIRDIMPYNRRNHIFKDKFYKLTPSQPSKTITAHMYYDCHMYIHPTQPRGLTPREAARIQGFPDDYFFLGSPNEWYRQIGNAVSPLVAQHVGYALAGILSEYGKDIL